MSGRQPKIKILITAPEPYKKAPLKISTEKPISPHFKSLLTLPIVVFYVLVWIINNKVLKPLVAALKTLVTKLYFKSFKRFI